MRTNIQSLCLSFIVIFTALFSVNAFSQKAIPVEQGDSPGEKIVLRWYAALENVRAKYAVSKEDFGTFKRFEVDSLKSIENVSYMGSLQENMDPALLSATMKVVEQKIGLLYEKFLNTENIYPSSVAEFRVARYTPTPPPCDSSGCTNINFGEGTLNTWYGYYAENTTGPPLGGWTGGALGAVTKGANDPNSEAYMNGASCELRPVLTNDYQILITSSGNDHVVPAIPRVSPYATGGHSVMLGDSQIVGRGAALLTKTFYVSANTANLTYQYAVLLMNPNHPPQEQPFFSVSVLDEHGDTIPNCGVYNVTSGLGIAGFDSLQYNGLCDEPNQKVYYRPWTIVNVSLKRYIGTCVTIEFEVADCTAGGHFGYAYVNASCSPAAVLSSSPGFCGQDSIILTGPPGAATYRWYGPVDSSWTGIRGSDSNQIASIDSVGIYRLITVPVTGATCADTLFDTIRKISGGHPKPSFHADTVCVGDTTRFVNTSTPTAGTYSWDFYNLGIYNYTAIPYKDTTWVYSAAGTYTVKLHELFGGCGYDTLIKVVVNPVVGPPSFTASPLCQGDSTLFTSSATNASIYDWNFGDPASGALNTSALQNTGHIFTHAGTFTVTVNANSGNACGNLGTFTVTITASPKPVISGDTSICVSTTDVLTATGGTTYVWNPGALSGSSITVTPATTTIYTVTASNGVCTHDTTFKVSTYNPPVTAISPLHDTICVGDTIVLTGSGAGVYKWSNGQTTSTISVNPIHNTTYYLRDSIKGSLCLDTASVEVFIRNALTSSISHDTTICPNQPVIITVTTSGESAKYQWSNGSSMSSITVAPSTTTTYTSVVSGIYCNNDTLHNTVTVIPLPVPVISGTNWKCKGIRDTLTVSNANGPATYLWDNGKTTTSITTGAINADSIISVTAYNSLGCPHDTSFTIALRHPDTIKISPPATFCAGSPVKIWGTITGNPNPSTYLWSPGGETTDTITVSPADTTSYVLTVSNGCKTTKATILTPNYPLLAACCSQVVTLENDTATPSYVVMQASGNSAKYAWSPAVTCLNPPLCDSIKVAPTPSVTTTYTVIGTDSNGCETSQVLTITVDIPCFNLVIPNVFTPTNGGVLGLDKVFYIKTDNINGWSITIFDRWGKQMFSTTDQYKYWDGTTEGGGNAPSGVYYYIITGTCQSTSYKKDGFLQLIR